MYADFSDTLVGGDGDDYLESSFGFSILYGGDGNDTLVGGVEGNDILYGGDGNDTLLGGTEGDDTLYGGNGDDYLEGSTEGNDTSHGNQGNDTLVGTNQGNNNLYGGNGNDILVGGNEGSDILVGSFGSDTLTGSGGENTFDFYSPYLGIDTITDFVVANDTITVSASGFGSGPTPGAAITPDQFVIGLAASDASNRFIYNPNSGGLFFDTDGVGTTRQVRFASLSTGLTMTSDDIFIIA